MKPQTPAIILHFDNPHRINAVALSGMTISHDNQGRRKLVKVKGWGGGGGGDSHEAPP